MYRTDVFYTHVPDDWPLPANKEAYESYAQLPAWTVEQAATLAAGYIPRTTYLDLYPDPAEPSKAPRPHPDARTWGQLLRNGEIGRILNKFLLYRSVYLREFSSENPYLKPSLFLACFDACDIPVSRELRDAVLKADAKWRDRANAVAGYQSGSHTESQQWEASYRRKTVLVARELKTLHIRMRQRDLLVCVNVEFPQLFRTASRRQFWSWIKKWQAEPAADGLPELLSCVVLRRSGRPSLDGKNYLMKNLPPKWGSALESHWECESKSAKARKSRKPRTT